MYEAPRTQTNDTPLHKIASYGVPSLARGQVHLCDLFFTTLFFKRDRREKLSSEIDGKGFFARSRRENGKKEKRYRGRAGPKKAPPGGGRQIERVTPHNIARKSKIQTRR